MTSVMVNKFICPQCSSQTALSIAPPLMICCSSCGKIFRVDAQKNATETALQKSVQPVKTITLGATGVYNKEKFEIVGLLRRVSNNAISNEWLMKFTSGREAWLAESGFHYFVFESSPLSFSPALIKGKKVGDPITLGPDEYTIVDLARQVDLRIDGQIPEDSYNDQPFYIYETVRIKQDGFASICIYDKDNAEAFKGVAVRLADLEMSTLSAFSNWM